MTILFSTSHSFGAEKYQLANKPDIAKLIEVAGSQSASNAWHFNNLYDSSSDSFLIPYQLWSGEKCDGVKSAEKCMHKANTTWKYTNARNKQTEGKITSPVKFTHPSSGNVFETFEWKSKRGSQNLVCYERGMARIYDFRCSILNSFEIQNFLASRLSPRHYLLVGRKNPISDAEIVGYPLVFSLPKNILLVLGRFWIFLCRLNIRGYP